MQRFSYEWVDQEEGEAPHWSDGLYNIFDGKLGLSTHQTLAYTIERCDAELIVDALNAAEERRQMASAMWQLAKRREQFDLSDLLD